MTKWLIRGVLAASLLVSGLQSQAQAQTQVSESTVEAVGFLGAVTDNLGTTFGGGMHFGANRLIFSAEVGYLTIEGDNISGLSIDLDANYLFPLANNSRLTPYVLGGLGILRFSVSGPGFDESDSDTGLNLGGGLRYQAGTNWGIRPEVKFLVHDDTSTRFTIGVYYSFGR